MQERIKLIAVVGPTASGKSELAVFLARYIKKSNLGGYQGAEIISADSRQIYKYLDVGTNKVPGKWQKRIFMYKNIPHYCIDFVHPKKTFTAAEYKTCAEQAISEIVQRGHIPILVGGTGFYIQAVVDGITLPEVSPNLKFRKRLEKKSAEELFVMLQKLDPNRAVSIDAKNPRRLIRAIEIATALGKVPVIKKQSPYDVLLIGIKKPDTELKAAIAERSKKQIPGLIKEIKLLRKLKIPQKRIRELGFEYRLALAHLEAELPSLLGRPVSKLELAHMLTRENWRYVKRQMTWFKKDKRICLITTKKDAERLVRTFLKN
ncbi:MAG: tRNA dimethylallyltransferase [Parcubacteria group bacterium Gr01-1014_29]|nr:MAG: tRNA dimethylallyltransferase [Parcubacteria group bacterium Gr01-1014_29]